MTPDQLRALADALEPMAKAPRFEDFDVPAFCAWVRAQADAQPVAWIARNLTTGRVKWTTDRCRARGWTRDANLRVKLLYAHPAPAVPAGWQLVPVNPTPEMLASTSWPGCAGTDYAHMLAAAPAAPQAEPIDPHMIVADDRFPDAQAEPKRQPVSEATALIEWPESAKWKNRAAPEGIERSCMGEPKRGPLSDERIAEIQRAAYERAAQECIETAAELRRCADGCTDGRYDWKADGALDCADAIHALGRQHD